MIIIVRYTPKPYSNYYGPYSSVVLVEFGVSGLTFHFTSAFFDSLGFYMNYNSDAKRLTRRRGSEVSQVRLLQYPKSMVNWSR